MLKRFPVKCSLRVSELWTLDWTGQEQTKQVYTDSEIPPKLQQVVSSSVLKLLPSLSSHRLPNFKEVKGHVHIK